MGQAPPQRSPVVDPHPSNGSALGARRRSPRLAVQDDSIGLTEGDSPGPRRHGNRPESAGRIGGGAAPGVSPRRPYKGTGRGGVNAVPEHRPGAGSPDLPGPRARQGPRTASPDQPRPPGPAPPSRSGAASCQALPDSTQPGRSPPARGPGSDFAPGPTGVEGAGQCLEATPVPGRAGTAASYLELGALTFCQEVWGPSPHTSLGAGVSPPSLMWVTGPTPVSVCGSPHHPEYLKGGSFPSSELSPSSEGTPPEPLPQKWVKV